MSAQLLELLEQMDRPGASFDALILQRDDGGNNAPCYTAAVCIIQKVNTYGGRQYCCASLFNGRAGSGKYSHDIIDVGAFAEEWYESKVSNPVWIGVEYCDPTFPTHLIR